MFRFISITMAVFLTISSSAFTLDLEEIIRPPHVRPLPRPITMRYAGVAAIVEIYEHTDFQGILLVARENGTLALPSRRIGSDQTIEQTVNHLAQEAQLELSDLRQFHVYCDDYRYSIHQFLEIAYLARLFSWPIPTASQTRITLVKLDAIPWDKLNPGHKQILEDYIGYTKGRNDLTILFP